MLGVIAGDVIGSRFEWDPIKTIEFPLLHPLSRFTDDTVLTVATAWAMLEGRPFKEAYLDFGRRYPNAGYGDSFYTWLGAEDPQPYNSCARCGRSCRRSFSRRSTGSRRPSPSAIGSREAK